MSGRGIHERQGRPRLYRPPRTPASPSARLRVQTTAPYSGAGGALMRHTSRSACGPGRTRGAGAAVVGGCGGCDGSSAGFAVALRHRRPPSRPPTSPASSTTSPSTRAAAIVAARWSAAVAGPPSRPARSTVASGAGVDRTRRAGRLQGDDRAGAAGRRRSASGSSGPVAESYPVQATAGVVDDPRPVRLSAARPPRGSGVAERRDVERRPLSPCA